MSVQWGDGELTPEQIEALDDAQRSTRMVGIVVLIAIAGAVTLLMAAGGALVTMMGGGL